jgi:hypothetical protein
MDEALGAKVEKQTCILIRDRLPDTAPIARCSACIWGSRNPT